ncbi:MAG: amino acid ABC transporter substrate-binding protein [Desulfobacterales bacterium]|nr:amino acid ABC transporter substrate-binding protein [Desulfobacterales bacterium]MCP4161386.1 amino acid ABC transporter substrate-binding protein [Deltaproteobacteria bacterium]
MDQVRKAALVICAFLLFATSVTGTELKFTTQDFSPFSYKTKGVVSGPAADIIRKICKEMKIKCSFRLLPWTRAQIEVKKGKANGMFVIGWNKERAKWLYFTPAIMNTEYGFFVKDDNRLSFKQVSDIKGFKIAVYGPSNTSKSLKKIKAKIKILTIDLRPDDESGFRKTSKKKVDAVYSNRDVGYALIKKIGLKNIRYAGSHKKLKYYIGFSKQFNNKIIVDRFNSTFLDLQKRGVIQKILRKHFK